VRALERGVCATPLPGRANNTDADAAGLIELNIFQERDVVLVSAAKRGMAAFCRQCGRRSPPPWICAGRTSFFCTIFKLIAFAG